MGVRQVFVGLVDPGGGGDDGWVVVDSRIAYDGAIVPVALASAPFEIKHHRSNSSLALDTLPYRVNAVLDTGAREPRTRWRRSTISRYGRYGANEFRPPAAQRPPRFTLSARQHFYGRLGAAHTGAASLYLPTAGGDR